MMSGRARAILAALMMMSCLSIPARSANAAAPTQQQLAEARKYQDVIAVVDWGTTSPANVPLLGCLAVKPYPDPSRGAESIHRVSNRCSFPLWVDVEFGRLTQGSCGQDEWDISVFGLRLNPRRDGVMAPAANDKACIFKLHRLELASGESANDPEIRLFPGVWAIRSDAATLSGSNSLDVVQYLGIQTQPHVTFSDGKPAEQPSALMFMSIDRKGFSSMRYVEAFCVRHTAWFGSTEFFDAEHRRLAVDTHPHGMMLPNPGSSLELYINATCRRKSDGLTVIQGNVHEHVKQIFAAGPRPAPTR